MFQWQHWYKIVPTLGQLCKDRQMWTIHSDMVTSPELYLKVWEGLNNDMIFFGMQGWYCDIKFRPLFSVNTLKVPERYFHFRSRNMRNDKSELETFQKNCPRLKLSELFSKQLLFKECSVTNHCHKKLDFFLTKKGFKTNLF